MAHKHRTESRAGCQGRKQIMSGALRGLLHTCSASTEPTLRSCRRFSFVLPVGECHRTNRLSCRPHLRRLRTAGACTGCSNSLSVQVSQRPNATTSTFTTQQAKSATLNCNYQGLHSTHTFEKGEHKRSQLNFWVQPQTTLQHKVPLLFRRQRETRNTAQHSQLPANSRIHPQTDKQNRD